MTRYNQLQLREVFHIEFLRCLGRKLKMRDYALKRGVNLRLFFKSIRYSEDMDLDARSIAVFRLKEAVMDVLGSSAFCDNLRPFGIARISAPDIAKAKQTETTQRFKAHLLTSSGEDLFTKIEFSRRGFDGEAAVSAVDNSVLRAYRLAPLLVPHYGIDSVLTQKLGALALRSVVQARDIFDLYILSSQYTADRKIALRDSAVTSKAYDRIFEVEFEQFRDTVVSYLSDDDQAVYNSPESWEEVKLKTAGFINEVRKANA